jgi:hypothetical protein
MADWQALSTTPGTPHSLNNALSFSGRNRIGPAFVGLEDQLPFRLLEGMARAVWHVCRVCSVAVEVEDVEESAPFPQALAQFVECRRTKQFNISRHLLLLNQLD